MKASSNGSLVFVVRDVWSWRLTDKVALNAHQNRKDLTDNAICITDSASLSYASAKEEEADSTVSDCRIPKAAGSSTTHGTGRTVHIDREYGGATCETVPNI